jgi:hypothetical protein
MVHFLSRISCRDAKLCSAEVMNEWIYTSTPANPFMTCKVTTLTVTDRSWHGTPSRGYLNKIATRVTSVEKRRKLSLHKTEVGIGSWSFIVQTSDRDPLNRDQTEMN